MKLSPHLPQGLACVCAFAAFAAVSLHAAEPRTVPGLGLKLMPIPAGTFAMGKTGRVDIDGPQTEVTISRPFWLGRTEVTHAQWRELMATDLIEQARRMLADDTLYTLQGKQQTARDFYKQQKDTDPRELVYNAADDAPMYWVSWDEATAFCRRLTERESAAGRLPGGYEYRLPTEAEWEYACRAGSTEATYAGDLKIIGRSNAPVLDAIAWYAGNSSEAYTGKGQDTAGWPEKQYPGGTASPRAVATKKPNAWGLHDMLGNVWEWCGDRYAEKLSGGSVSDPSGPETGSQRVDRGGGWDTHAAYCRSAFRARNSQGRRGGNLGFRVALAPRLTSQGQPSVISPEVANAATTTTDESPRALAARGLANVTALARLVGYVRYFHPSDEAAAADWDAIAVRGMRDVESAADADELANRLQAIVSPIAPSVRVFPTNVEQPETEPVSGSTGDLRAIAWLHMGIDAGQPRQLYQSKRFIDSFRSAVDIFGYGTPSPAPEFPDPRKAVVYAVEGGVSIALPLAVFANAENTLPRARPVDSKPSPTKPRYSGNDRGSRLAAVALGWNIVQHSWPYFDVVPIDWPKALRVALEKAATDRGEVDFLVTLQRMIAALPDGHGRANVKGDTNYPYPGIRWTWAGDTLVVADVLTPSIEGIGRGDAVLSIDGRPVAKAFEDAANRIASATPQWTRHRSLVEMAQGPRDSEMRLEIEPFDRSGERRQVTVRRDSSLAAWRKRTHARFSELQPGIFYFDLGGATEADVKAALPQLERGRAVVFDMRGFFGFPQHCIEFFSHLIDQPISFLNFRMPMIARPDHTNLVFSAPKIEIAPKPPRLSLRMVFLTDGRAVSAPESFMSIVEYHKFGEIIGEPTAGTNGDINTIDLPGGYSLTFTGLVVLKHDDSRHHGVGTLPTIPLAPTRAGIAAGRDELLERAIEGLKVP